MKQLDAQQINQKELEQEKKRRLINVLAPPVVEIEADFIKLGGVFVRTLFISSYPRFLSQNWISPIINLDETVDVSIFIQPIPTESVLKKLESQLTGVEADMMEREKKGLIRDPLLEAAYTNIEDLRDKMQTSEERVFKFGLYLMLYGKTKEALEDVENKIKS